MSNEEKLELKDFLMESIIEQYKHEYPTEADIESKFGKMDTLEHVVSLLFDIKSHKDYEMYCKKAIEKYPNDKAYIVQLFALDLTKPSYDRQRAINNYYKVANALLEIATMENVPKKLHDLTINAARANRQIIDYINEEVHYD